MGGRYAVLESLSPFEFRKFTKTFESRQAELSKDIEDKTSSVNIGVDYQPAPRDKSEPLSVSIANRRNKDLEQAARLNKLSIPLDTVRSEWSKDLRVHQTKVLADHYGIYHDLFGDAYFMPVVNLNVCYDYDDELVTPVYRGNCILPAECKSAPYIEYEADESSLWTLVMTNPDSHLTQSDSEYVHWLVGNIPGCNVAGGELLVDYLQPFPVRGTGFHRHVFLLFQQNKRLDLSKWKRQQPCNSLDVRTFKTSQFFEEYRSDLTPKGLAFFQSEWDESVRHVFHNVLDMSEPSYEYSYPVPYHPPPKKYPHKEPFNRYFDRYRDKKDLAEEVLRMKLQVTSPFKGRPPQDKYPLIHREKTYKPSWLKLREELMHRRLEQFKDLQ